MANVQIDSSNLVITMKGLRRFLTFKRELTFPLTSVRGVTHDPNISADYPSGWEKRVGTNIFNTYYGGTYKKDGDTVFWDVLRAENAVVITLNNEEFQRLIIEVDDPKSTVREIEHAMNAGS